MVMLKKICSISNKSFITELPDYVSTSLNHELSINQLNQSSFGRIQKAGDLLKKEILSQPEQHLMNILQGLSEQNDDIKLLHKMVIQHAKLDLINKNPAYKALILIVRQWPKKNWHVHFSDFIDGKYVMEQTNQSQIESFDYQTSTFHINDDWIKTTDDFVKAYKYAIRQLLEDGISDAQIRFNPYKTFISNDHHVRLDKMHNLLKRLQGATASVFEDYKNKLMFKPNYSFIFGLNRRKYARKDPQIMMDIISTLTDIKQSETGNSIDSFLNGIDICGGEILDWEWNGEKRTEWGSVLFEKLSEAKKAGYTIVTHLGDIRNYNEDLVDRFYNDTESLIHSILLNFEGYLYELEGLDRIGHATIVHDAICSSDRTHNKLKDILSILNGHVPNSAYKFVEGLSKENFLNIKYHLVLNGYLEGPRLTNTFQKTLNNPIEKKALINLIKSAGLDLIDSQIKRIYFILKQINSAKYIKLERCFYDDVITLLDIHDKSPMFFWKEKGLDFVLGIDGFIHHRYPEFYDFFSEHDYLAISFSQWIVMVMLSAPQTNGWTVEYVKSLALEKETIDID